MSKQNRFDFLNERFAQLLETDPESLASLATLEGSSIVLLNADFVIGLELTVNQGQLQVQPIAPEHGAPKVVGGLSAVRRMLQGRQLSVDALLKACEIEGDADEVRRWFEVLVGIRPDFAKLFSGALADEKLDALRDAAHHRLHDLTTLLSRRRPPPSKPPPDKNPDG